MCDESRAREGWERLFPERKGSPELEALIDEQERLDAVEAWFAQFPIPRCPAGCDLLDGHAWDGYTVDGARMVRTHQVVSLEQVTVEILETIRDDGLVERGAPEVLITSTDEVSRHTADEARALAAELLAAADRIEVAW